MFGAATAGLVGYGAYRHFDKFSAKDEVAAAVQSVLPVVTAASAPTSQPSVFSPGKNHALYLWINLKPSANSKDVGKVCSKLQKMVDTVVDPTMKDEDDEILAGVGFGPNFYSQVAGGAPKNYNYPHRKGALGDMPSSGGDVFVHAKSNEVQKTEQMMKVDRKLL